MSPDPIEVTERSHTDIDADTFASLSSEPAFWALLDARVLSVGRPSRNRARLHGSRFVGQAIVGDQVVRLVEKVPGSLACLISYASGGAFRVSRADAAASASTSLVGLLVRAFLEQVRRYVFDGIDFRYARRGEVGSLMGGPLDIPRTIKIRARGAKHLAAFSRPFVDQALPKNRVTLAALRQVEVLADVGEIASDDIAAARMLSQFFVDAEDTEVLLGSRDRWAVEARSLKAMTADDESTDLLALAAVILSHESFGTTLPVGRVPRSWFLNLETLFENAVREVLREQVSAPLRVFPASTTNPPIFPTVAGYLNADPDLVIGGPDSTIAIGDVKYKRWNGLQTSGLHSDVYQLLVHARAFGAETAFLVYAHDAFGCEHLGRAATGADTWLFAVDVRSLDGELQRAVDEMQLAREQISVTDAAVA